MTSGGLVLTVLGIGLILWVLVRITLRVSYRKFLSAVKEAHLRGQRLVSSTVNYGEARNYAGRIYPGGLPRILGKIFGVSLRETRSQICCAHIVGQAFQKSPDPDRTLAAEYAKEVILSTKG